MKRFFLTLTLSAFVCLICFGSSSAFAQTQSQIDANLSRIEKEIAAAQLEVSSLTEKKSTLQSQLDSLKNRIANTESLITQNEESLKQIDGDIKKTQSEIELVNSQIRLIIRDIQIQSQGSPIELVLSSKNFGDAISNLMNYVNLQDQANQLREDKVSFESQLKTRKEQEEKAKEGLNQLQLMLSNSRDETNFLLAQTEGNQQKYEQLLASQKSEKEKWENTVAVAPKPAPQPISPSPRPSPTPNPGNPGNPSPAGFIYPSDMGSTTTSRCQSGHGYPACDFPTQSFNPTPPIFASKSGTITRASSSCANNSVGCNSGYGNFIKINHGDGTETLYAHLFGVFVSEGQSVSQGHQIGQMGCSGSSFGMWNPVLGCSGTHLHFEIRINGVAVNPVGYIPMPRCESGNCG